MTSQTTLQQLLALIEDYHDYNPGYVPVYPWPTAVDFSKQVSKGTPCLYPLPSHHTGVQDVDGPSDTESDGASKSETSHTSLESWPALRWTRDHLLKQVQEPIEVAITPNGRADALHAYGSDNEKIFLEPATTTMSMCDLLDRLSTSIKYPDDPVPAVHYLQSQNSNLTSTSLRPLLNDLPSNFPFAAPVLGEPEAINIWIGDARSVTSTHRDPYENLYLVLNGSKTFTLYPPIEEVCMDTQLVRTGTYVYHAHDESSSSTSPTFSIALDDDDANDDHPESDDTSQQQPQTRIPWVPIDPTLPHSTLTAAHPLYAHARPLTVTVHAQQHILYLPAGWYHHVTQKPGVWHDNVNLMNNKDEDEQSKEAPCIAVNYWFDQDYEGEKYVMRQMVGRLVEKAREEMGGG